MNRRLLPSIAVLLALSGCAAGKSYSAAQQYRASNPHASLEYLSLCLKADPAHEEAKAMALEIGRQLASDSATKLEQLERDQRFEDAVKECDRMVVAADLVAEMPGNMSVFFDPDTRARTANKAAKQFFDQGKSLEEQGNMKDAAVAYRRCIGFKPSYPEATACYNRCRQAAMTKLALQPFVVDGRDGRELVGSVTEKFRTAIMALPNEFMTLAAGNAQADGRINGKIVANYQDTGWKAEQKSHEHSVPVEAKDAHGNPVLDANGQPTQAVDANGNPEVRVFKATWTVYHRETTGAATISFDVVLKDGSIAVSGSKDVGGHDSVVYRSPINGDVEAVRNSPTPEDMDLPDHKTEPRAPAALVAGAIDEPIKQLAHLVFDKFQ